jgi:hypothetical protein
MRDQLLACLETFVSSIEREMDTAVHFIDTCQGVVVNRSRRDHICPGYDRREYIDTRQLASLLLQTAAQFVFFKESVMYHLKLSKEPTSAQMQEILDVLHVYQESGGQIGYPERDPVHLCGPQYRKTLWDEVK